MAGRRPHFVERFAEVVTATQMKAGVAAESPLAYRSMSSPNLRIGNFRKLISQDLAAKHTEGVDVVVPLISEVAAI